MGEPIRLVDLNELVGRAEIARRAGIKERTVDSWRRRHSEFPEPLTHVSGTPLWLWPDVAAWIENTSHEPGRPSSAPIAQTPYSGVPARLERVYRTTLPRTTDADEASGGGRA